MAPTIATLKDLANLSHLVFVNLLKAQGNYKERSQKAFVNVHKLELEALNKALTNKDEKLTTSAASPLIEKKGKEVETQTESSSFTNRSPQTLLIGDSVLERLKNLPTPPPQTILLGWSAIERLKQPPSGSPQLQLSTLSSSINLGCGGDKIKNLLYCLYAGTYRLLLPLPPSIKLIITLQVGTRNLRPLSPLTATEYAKYGLLLVALLKITPGATRV